MSDDARTDAELREDLLRRLDPGGEMGELMRTFAPVLDSKFARGLLGLFGIPASEIAEPLAEANRLIDDMGSAILTFTPVGWAASSAVPADLYAEALDVYRKTGSIDQAEHYLVEGWNKEDRIRYLLNRLKRLGAAHEPLRALFMRRWVLVDRALKHHQAGAYEASVPIVLAQADGIVWDLTDPPRGLFTARGGRDHLMDAGTVAGVPEGLRPLILYFSEGMKESGMTGKLSRHGILHGRELGYDTLINSTKCFVMLLAVIELAQPKARELAERLDRDREMRHAGSHETDEDGRRLDTRGFREAKESLNRLSTIQMGQWRNHDRYGRDLEAIQPGRLGDQRMHGRHNIHLTTSDDGHEFYAWRETPSGFCFGIGGRGGPPDERRYAGVGPPPDDLDAEEWKGTLDPWPADW